MVAPPIFVQAGVEVDFPVPRNKRELQTICKNLLGITVPENAVCEGHVAPLDVLWYGFTAKDPVQVWKASRGFGGKSTLLGTLSILEMFTGMRVTVLGGSAQQSRRVHEVTDDIWDHKMLLPDGGYLEAPFAHLLKADPSKMETKAKNGAWMRALTASTKSARGPHPQRMNLDEVDEMDLGVFDAAMGQTMSGGTNFKPGTIISSTHQYSDKTMTEVLSRAKSNGWPVFEWCYKETSELNEGWLPESDIAQKRVEVTKLMWETEYDLNEPSVEGRAFDSEALELMFQRDLGDFEGRLTEYIEIEGPVLGASYATGADWAQTRDMTAIVTLRLDVNPVRVVAFERTHRQGWPIMIGKLNRRMALYGGRGAHDATGGSAGSVIKDMLEFPVDPIQMQGGTRRTMFSDLILSAEHGDFEAPFIRYMYDEFRYCTVDDLFGNGHPPDTIVAMALAWMCRDKEITIPGFLYQDMTGPSKWTI